MKRFYDMVGTREREGAWQVTLDGRGLKTVKGADQVVPSRKLVEALASEWDTQSEDLDPASFPMRDMADYAIDVVAHTRGEVASKLITYADTDTLLYRADPDEAIFAKQEATWEPILTAFERREGLTLKRVSGVIHALQDKAALAKLRDKIAGFDPFTLAGLEAMTSLAASLTIGLTALEPDADPVALWQAASLEEEWQADEWGRDYEAEERRAKRQTDFLRACEFAKATAA
ncbi:MAG: ATP12 family protein [Pseudomonadota bacterium]